MPASIIEIPADLLKGSDVRFQIGRRHLTSPQPFTAHLRASGPIDERWLVEITLPTKKRTDLDRFDALFDLGDGLAAFYSVFDAVHAYPRGTATGLSPTGGARFSDGATFSDGSEFESGIAQSTLTAAAARGAEYITIGGLLASQTIGFAPRDMISIAQGSENYGFLHTIVATAPTDAAGAATVRIRPRLREAVAINQVVHFLRPRGVFRLAEEDAAAFSRGPGGLGQPTLSLVEAPEALTCAI